MLRSTLPTEPFEHHIKKRVCETSCDTVYARLYNLGFCGTITLYRQSSLQKNKKSLILWGGTQNSTSQTPLHSRKVTIKYKLNSY